MFGCQTLGQKTLGSQALGRLTFGQQTFGQHKVCLIQVIWSTILVLDVMSVDQMSVGQIVFGQKKRRHKRASLQRHWIDYSGKKVLYNAALILIFQFLNRFYLDFTTGRNFRTHFAAFFCVFFAFLRFCSHVKYDQIIIKYLKQKKVFLFQPLSVQIYFFLFHFYFSLPLLTQIRFNNAFFQILKY